MTDDRDIERERIELLQLISERTDEPLLRALALVPEERQKQRPATVTTSTEGTDNAREE